MTTRKCTVDVEELLNTWEDEIKNVNMYGGFWDWLDFRIRPPKGFRLKRASLYHP